MIKYYNKNLVEMYRYYLIGCLIIVALSGMLTFYVVINNFQKYKTYMTTTYVYSSNGSSIEVNLKK